MQKMLFSVFLLSGLLVPLSLFAAGGKDTCELNIENKTGTQVTQIIIAETESQKKLQSLVKNMANNTSTAVQIKRNILYDIILVNTDGRQYAKKRQTWDEETASIIVERRDLLNPTIWDKAKDAIEASAPVLEEGYRKVKEEDGIRKAAATLGKLTEAGLKAGVDFTIGAGKIIVRVSRYAMEKIEQERKQKLNADERALLDEYVEFSIVNDEQE